MIELRNDFNHWADLVDAQICRLLGAGINDLTAPYSEWFLAGLSPMDAALAAIDFEPEEDA